MRLRDLFFVYADAVWSTMIMSFKIVAQNDDFIAKESYVF